MNNFEDVRAWSAKHFSLKDSEPYLLSIEVPVGARRQSIFMAELERDNQQPVLRVSTPICKMSRVNSERCLSFNWAQRVGFLAVGELGGKEWLHLCENRPYPGLNSDELKSIVFELSELADALELKLSGEDLG